MCLFSLFIIFAHQDVDKFIFVDDSDIASNASHTPRFTGSFPKVELQKSFFSQPTVKPRNVSNKPPPRRVQFAPTNMEANSDVRERARSSSNFHQSNGSTSSDSVLVRGSVLRCSGGSNPRSVSLNDSADKRNPRSVSLNDSADKRLDELITNGLTNGSPLPMKGDVQNIRCLSPPPPLPPRNGRENSAVDPPNLPPKPNVENIQLSQSSITSEHSASSSVQSFQCGENHVTSEVPLEDDEGEYVFPKELLVNVNKQILDTQHHHRLSTRQQHSPSSPRDDVCKLITALAQYRSRRTRKRTYSAIIA
jgi:hypothetical protein